MKKFLLGFCALLVFPGLIKAQEKYDYVWPHGSGKVNVHLGYSFGGMLIDFKKSPAEINLKDFILDYPFASISDKHGNLVACTDGCRISNRNNDLMLNGDSLSPGKVFNSYCIPPFNQFYPLVQPCIFLPKPGSDSLYYLFHLRSDDKYRIPMDLLYSEIDASKDNGNGAVIRKNIPILSDSLHLGQYVTATRHANGRDWWVVVTRLDDNRMHLTLVTPDTVQYMGMQEVGISEVDEGPCCNQTRFTPDGSKFFRNHQGGMLILDFDRCTGTFSNPVHWDYDTISPTGSGGVSFSHDSRFLYLTTGLYVQQLDLRAPDILASREIVAEYDGYVTIDPTYFFHAQLAPDGKIYVLTTSNADIMHIIHHPEKKGLACRVEQHGLQLPARGSYFEPNFPNYRLGPIDGSSCDTLGIDNFPVSLFRYESPDTLSPQQIEFTDLSYHEPATWHWFFGDGAESQDTSPVHLYPAPGIYTACLEVCNQFGCDTICQEITIEALGTSTISLDLQNGVKCWPNPALEVLNIETEEEIQAINVFDVMHRKAVGFVFTAGKKSIQLDTHAFTSGVYILNLIQKGKLVSRTFVKG